MTIYDVMVLFHWYLDAGNRSWLFIHSIWDDYCSRNHRCLWSSWIWCCCCQKPWEGSPPTWGFGGQIWPNHGRSCWIFWAGVIWDFPKNECSVWAIYVSCQSTLSSLFILSVIVIGISISFFHYYFAIVSRIADCPVFLLWLWCLCEGLCQQGLFHSSVERFRWFWPCLGRAICNFSRWPWWWCSLLMRRGSWLQTLSAWGLGQDQILHISKTWPFRSSFDKVVEFDTDLGCTFFWE